MQFGRGVIPLRQTTRTRHTPLVNRSLVAANVLSFLVQLSMGASGERLISVFGFIPARLVHPAAWNYNAVEVGVTLFTSLFLHGGVVHLLGNMIYLWVFGPAVEDVLGHERYLIFYLCCGAFGSVTHTMLFPASVVPSIGASGSIAGVLGAFLVLRPRARIVTVFPLVVYWAMAEIPALVFLPIWFLLQFFNGFMYLTAARATEEVAGIAWWAHVGGFAFGAASGGIARLLRSKGVRVRTETPRAAE